MTGFHFYHDEIPEHLALLSATPAMQRLKNVGMNCGCEYTQFPVFARCAPYSRFEHSIGVGLIVWHFTQSVAQSTAALLHDIATPAFAHVIDFLHQDHLLQESTEENTRKVIERSEEIQRILARISLTTDAVCDYHRYPIADNDTPQLSADRLEYTLGNAVNYGFADLEQVKQLYASLLVAPNEYGEEELMFSAIEDALAFGEIVMRCSNVYIADEDRFAMQALAELLREAIREDVLSVADLDRTEPELLAKLCAEPRYAEKWKQFCSYRRMERSDLPRTGWFQIPAKKRYIVPYVKDCGRLTALDEDYRRTVEEFRARTLDHFVMGFE